MTGKQEPRAQWRRRLRLALVGALGLIVLVLAAAHARFVRTAVLSSLTSRLEPAGLRLSADRLTYNLFTLSIGLDEVALAASTSDTPFFQAAAIRVDLPWSAVWGGLAFQSVEIEDARLVVDVGADGATNLPTLGGAEPAGASTPLEPVLIDRLLIRDLDLSYTDAARDAAVVAAGLVLDLWREGTEPLAGTLTVAEPIALRAAGRDTMIETFEGRLAFDGETLFVTTFDLGAPELRAHLDGRVDLFTADPRADFRYDVSADVGRLAPWVGLEAQDPTGMLNLSGVIDGAVSALRVQADLTSDGLMWPTLGAVSLQARTTVSPEAAVVESFTAALAGGEVAGAATVRFDDTAARQVGAAWRDVDLAVLTQLAPELPIRVASMTGGDLDFAWIGADVMNGRGRAAVTFRAPVSAPGALPLSGQLTFVTDQRRWTLEANPRVAGIADISGVVDGRFADDILATTLGGNMRVSIESARDALSGLSVGGYPLVGDDLVSRLDGTAVLDVMLGGTFGAPRASGVLDASDAWFDDTGPGRARASVSLTTEDLGVESLRIDLGPNVVAASGSVRLASGALNGELTASLPELALLAASLPVEWQPEGTAQVTATFGGVISDPVVDLHLASSDLRIAGQSVDSLQSHVGLAGGVVTVEDLELDQGQGHLSLTARYETQSGQYTLDATATNLAMTPLFAPVEPGGNTDAPSTSTLPIDARFDVVQLRGGGTVDAPQLDGLIEMSRVTWGEYQLGTVTSTIGVGEGRAQLRTEIPALTASLVAALGLEDKTFSVDATLADADLAALVRRSGPGDSVAVEDQAADAVSELSGTLALRAAASGRFDDLAAMTAEVDLDFTNVNVFGLPVQVDRPARLRYADQQFIADDVEVRVGASTLTASGRVGAGVSEADALSVALLGSVQDFLPLARRAPAAEGLEASGQIDARFRMAGSLEAPDLSGAIQLTDGAFGSETLPPVSGIALGVAYADGIVELTDGRAAWQGAVAAASGRLPLEVLGDMVPEAYRRSLPPVPGPARLEIHVASVTPQVLAPFLDPDTVGRIGAGFDIRATVEATSMELSQVTADLTFERAEIAVAGIPMSQTQPTRLRFADGRLDVVEWSWAGAGNHLAVTGSVRVDDDAPVLDLGLSASVDLQMIAAFAPDVATSGLATIDVRATGTTADPTIEGELVVSDADFIVRDPRVAITDLSGAATLTKDDVRLRDVTASVNGGTVLVEGSFAYQDFTWSRGSLTLRGRGLAFAVPEGPRTEVDADLVLAVDGDARSLKGQITVLGGFYREPLSLTTQLFGGSAAGVADPEDVEPSLLDALQLDVAVVSADDLSVDNNYARIDVGTNLRVAGTAGQPVLSGRLTVQEGGEVFLGGRTYQVRRGTIDFTNPTRIEPTIDVALDTRVQRYDITLEISGTPDTLEASLRSPGTSQEDVVSLLLTGQTAEGESVAQTQIARGQLLMLLSGEFLGFAGRAVGLDSVQVGRGLGGAASNFDLLGSDTDPSARLTVAKQLSRDVEIIFSQSLRESGDITWIASYRPVRNIELRGTTEDDNSRSYEFRHELAFGGPTRLPVDQVVSSRVEAATVVDIQFSGTPGTSDADLQSVVRLTAGDRFDFYRWQRDHDRLLAWYHDRDFLEARLTARRQELEGERGVPGVVLDYRIEQGPRTTLTVIGFTLPGDVIAAMKARWAQAVFDGFLLDDLQGMVREELIRDGYLQAQVEARVVSPPAAATKEISIDVAPGPRFEERGLTFSGNTRFVTADLLAEARARGRDVTAWLNPEPLRVTLERYYRARGYLAVAVTIGEPAFSGSSATLPVRVDEGPLFQVGSVDVQGVTARSPERVLATFGQSPGAAYLPSSVEPARRDVENAYLREGYNNARVAVATLVDREQARVDIAVTVVEGPQQVLAGVDVRGADVTASSTVERALDLDVGTPADLRQLYRAQKRLYDTGVFQSADIAIDPLQTDLQVSPGTQLVRAAVTLRELPRYRFRYGLRLNDQVAPGGLGDDLAPVEPTRRVTPALVADLLRRNLFGLAVSGGIAGQIEADRRLARGILSLPRLFGLPLVTSLFVTSSREYFPAESEFGIDLVERVHAVTVEQRARPVPSMAVTYGYTFEDKLVFEPDPVGFFPVFIPAKIARLTGTYAWDTRDDPGDARHGWFHSSGVEFGATALGSDLRYIKYLGQQYYFRQVADDRVVLASAFRLGAGRAFGGQRLDQTFLAGGGTSVRGFAEDGLGEADELFGSVGGNAMLVLNQEVRFPMYGWVRGVGFIDVGNVFPKAGDLSFANLEAGIGVGLRVHSPFALLRLDFGVPLTRRGLEPRGRWYFAIGHAF